jgi:hypothetical protein
MFNIPCTFTKSARVETNARVDLISNVLPFDSAVVWRARKPPRMQSVMRNSTAARKVVVIRLYEAAGNLIETHEHAE